MGKKLLPTYKVDFRDEELGFRWYGVVTAVNHERKVAKMLEKRFETYGQSDKFKEVFVPIEEWEEETLGRVKKDGTRSKRKVKKSRHLLESGYIFVHMIMTNETWNIVRQTSGVAGWLKMDGRPQPVPVEDILKLKDILGEGKEARKEMLKDFNGKVGDKVKIIDGPFKGLEGNIINMKDMNITVTVDQLNGTKVDISPLALEII